MSGRRFTYDECGKTIVRGTMDAVINNVIYMELYSGPKMANGRCGKTMDRGSTVYPKYTQFVIVTSELLDCDYISDCPKGHRGHYLLHVANFLYTAYTQGL